MPVSALMAQAYKVDNMDTSTLNAFQQIIERELKGVAKQMELQNDSVLRAVAELGEEVKALELRMRATEISTSQLSTQVMADIGQLKGDVIKIEGDITGVGTKMNNWIKVLRATQEETIKYSQELFISKDDFEAYKEKAVEKWTAQEKLNTKNNMVIAGIGAIAGIMLTLVAGFFFDLVTHGGISQLVQSWGLSP